MDRKPYLKKVKRAVVKIGSGVLTRKNGLNLNLIDDITTEICKLRKKGIEIIHRDNLVPTSMLADEPDLD